MFFLCRYCRCVYSATQEDKKYLQQTSCLQQRTTSLLNNAYSSALMKFFWQHSLIMGEKKKPWPSKAIILNCGLLLLTFATLGSGVMCPDKCICDDKNLKHDCSDSGLEGIPIFFNPETKEIKVGPFSVANYLTLSV